MHRLEILRIRSISTLQQRNEQQKSRKFYATLWMINALPNWNVKFHSRPPSHTRISGLMMLFWGILRGNSKGFVCYRYCLYSKNNISSPKRCGKAIVEIQGDTALCRKISLLSHLKRFWRGVKNRGNISQTGLKTDQ